jgi:hypothetical protein
VVLVAGLLVLGIVFAIAAWIVVREAGRMTHEPPPVLFSLDEAYEWVVERLPDEVAATLTPSDVRRILAFQVEYFSDKGVASNGSSNGSSNGESNGGSNGAPSKPSGASMVVMVGPEVVSYIVRRAAATGDPYIPEQVYPVIEIQLEYLRAIGAVSTPVDEPVDPGTDADT